jgi:hypothetical protein
VLRLQVFVVGGAIAGLSGGLLVEFISAWSPGAWGYAETFVIFTALLIGGVGNNRGVIVGTFLVPILFLELPSFLPSIGYPGLIDDFEWIIIGLLWMVGLLLRPRGILPERRYIASRDGVGAVMLDTEQGFFGRLLSVGRGHPVQLELVHRRQSDEQASAAPGAPREALTPEEVRVR